MSLRNFVLADGHSPSRRIEGEAHAMDGLGSSNAGSGIESE